MIHIYESATAPANRRFIAQAERIKGSMFLTIQGSSAEVVTKKAKLMLEYQATDPKDRKAFDLKGKLSALNGAADDEEDLL